MTNVNSMKSQMIDSLWLPTVQEGGRVFYPRLRKNKKMKLLTLTNDRNFQEVVKFQENHLTQKEYTVAWARDSFKRIRLETESMGVVLEAGRYEDSILSATCPVHGHFSFDIINLDFSSQDPDLEDGRIEKEIESLERTIYLQNQERGNKFVLIYTTLIDSKNIDRDYVVRASDAIRINEWSGLNLSHFPQRISDGDLKKNFIEEVIKKICQKYGYTNIKINSSTLAMPRGQEQLYSIAGIFTR